jgi:hypothetical protein
MSGWNTIERIRRIEREIEALGFKFASSKNSTWTDDYGALCLKPKDSESLPIYHRDAELFVGSLDGLENWLHGVRWAREYDMMLRLSDEKKRARKEQDERNRNLLKTIKNSKIPEGIKA